MSEIKENLENFGGMAMTLGVFNTIKENLPDGSVVLEFGSGKGTTELVKRFKVYSVEQDLNWVGFVPESTYIHAEVKKDGWYEWDTVKNNLPERCDLIFVDGPTVPGKRAGIIQHLEFMVEKLQPKFIVFDDIDRQTDKENFHAAETVLKKQGEISEDGKCGLIILQNKKYD